MEIVRICLLAHLEKVGFKVNRFHNLWPTSPEESNYSPDQMNVGLYNHSQWPKQCPRTPVIHITKQWHTFGILPFVDVVTAVSMTGEAITSADPVVKCASVYLCTFQCKQTGSKGIRLTRLTRLRQGVNMTSENVVKYKEYMKKLTLSNSSSNWDNTLIFNYCMTIMCWVQPDI